MHFISSNDFFFFLRPLDVFSSSLTKAIAITARGRARTCDLVAYLRSVDELGTGVRHRRFDETTFRYESFYFTLLILIFVNKLVRRISFGYRTCRVNRNQQLSRSKSGFVKITYLFSIFCQTGFSFCFFQF